jgi:hypothetical protein
VHVEKVEIVPTAAVLLPPSAVPMELVDDSPSGLELDTGHAPAPTVAAPLPAAGDSALAQLVESHRVALDTARTREALVEALAALVDAISERGAVMEVRETQLVPVRILGVSADVGDPALALPLGGSTSFRQCLEAGRTWRGELNEPDELGFALRLGPTTRSVLVPVGSGGGPRWVLWGVVPATLASTEAEFGEFDRLSALASAAVKLLG